MIFVIRVESELFFLIFPSPESVHKKSAFAREQTTKKTVRSMLAVAIFNPGLGCIVREPLR
jgi:hypothetical protein